jgi:dethiobiotin synthetase
VGTGIFVAGTDISVGKSIAAIALLGALRARGVDAGLMRVVQCGTPSGHESSVELLEAATPEEDRKRPDDICPYRFETRVPPSVAATLAGVHLDPDVIRRAYDRLTRRHQVVIVKGAGGLLVPLVEDYLMADLVSDLGQGGIPILLVTRLSLGTVNHTLLSVEAARQRGLQVRGLIFNGLDPTTANLAERTNPDILTHLTGLPILGVLPYVHDLHRVSNPTQHLIELTNSALDLEPLEDLLP